MAVFIPGYLLPSKFTKGATPPNQIITGYQFKYFVKTMSEQKNNKNKKNKIIIKGKTKTTV